MAKKYLLGFFLIIVVLLIGVFWFYTFGIKNQTSPSEINSMVFDPANQQPAEDDISNWKTYRNVKHKLEVKYPSDWVLDNENQEMCDFGPSGDSEIVCVENVISFSTVYSFGNDNHTVWFDIIKQSCDETDGTWYSSMTDIVSKSVCKNGFLFDLGLFEDNPKKDFYKHTLDQILSMLIFLK